VVKYVEWIDYHKVLHNFKWQRRPYVNVEMEQEAKKYWKRITHSDIKSVYTSLPMNGLTKKELNGMVKELSKVNLNHFL
jgi:hypothetical protein